MPPKKDDLAKQLAETEAKLAAALEANPAAKPTEPSSDFMMKQFMAALQVQKDAAEAQRQTAIIQLKAQQEAADAAREVADAQLKAAKDHGERLEGKLNALMEELVDARRKGTPANTPSRLKVTPPPKLGIEMSVAKLKAWRKAWEDYAEMVKVSEMSLGEQQSLFRSLLSLDMRDVLEERIGVKKDQKPEDILDDIEAFIRKKRSVLLDMCAFDNRKQKAGENFDSYLVAIQQLAQDADLTFEHCDQCKVKCLDRRLAGRIISGIQDERTRTKLLEEEKFPSKDRVVEICAARESARENNKEQWGQNSGIHAVKNKFQRNRGRSQNRGQLPEQEGKCTKCCKDRHKSMEDCPAKDAECGTCKRKGHFTEACYFKEQQQEKSTQRPKDGKKFGRVIITNNKVGLRLAALDARTATAGSPPSPKVSVQISDPRTKESLGWHDAIADTGAKVCVGGLDLLKNLGMSKKNLQPAECELFSFNGKPEKSLGILPVELENKYYKTKAKVNICPQVTDNLLLSVQVCKSLGYVNADFPAVLSPTERCDPVPNPFPGPKKKNDPSRETVNRVQSPKTQDLKPTTHFPHKNLSALEPGQMVRV